MTYRIHQPALIYARSLNRCIGADGALPWSLPDEYAHFNQVTHGYPVIMGRRSYEDHDGALPDRLNIVVSRNTRLQVEADIRTAANLTAAMQMAEASNPGYFVIGGANLLTEALPGVGMVFETIVDAKIEGDVYLPAFDFSDWQTTLLFEHKQDQKHAYGFQALLHQRQ